MNPQDVITLMDFQLAVSELERFLDALLISVALSAFGFGYLFRWYLTRSETEGGTE